MDERVKVKIGRPRILHSELRSKNDARADLIRQARFSEYVSKSLQPCAVKDNRRVLEKLLQEKSNEKKKQQIQGLLEIFDLLHSNYVAENGREYDRSFVAFDEAMEIFFAFQDKAPPFVNTDKNKLTYALLHQDWGLCVYIIFVKGLNKKFIVLRPDSFGIEVFLNVICPGDDDTEEGSVEKMVLDTEAVQGIMSTVDTEWDRKVARVILSANRTRSQISKLGIDVDKVKTETNKVHICILYMLLYFSILIVVLQDNFMTQCQIPGIGVIP
jgi:hypothetical protein